MSVYSIFLLSLTNNDKCVCVCVLSIKWYVQYMYSIYLSEEFLFEDLSVVFQLLCHRHSIHLCTQHTHHTRNEQHDGERDVEIFAGEIISRISWHSHHPRRCFMRISVRRRASIGNTCVHTRIPTNVFSQNVLFSHIICKRFHPQSLQLYCMYVPPYLL